MFNVMYVFACFCMCHRVLTVILFIGKLCALLPCVKVQWLTILSPDLRGSYFMGRWKAQIYVDNSM